MHNWKLWAVVYVWAGLLSACNPVGLGVLASDSAQNSELTAEDKFKSSPLAIETTLQATQTIRRTFPATPNIFPVATVTLQPELATTVTVAPSMLNAQLCNWAQFIDDVNYPDGVEVLAGSSFAKTWRLKNVGACIWTPQYQLVFDHGDRMSAPERVALTQANVSPGESVDVSVSLNAPLAPGHYEGFYKLRAPDGTIFGIGNQGKSSFWVKVAVAAPTPTEKTWPDLIVTEFSLNPTTHLQGQNVHVRVAVYNDGNAASGQFTVQWWADDSAAKPDCIWTILSAPVRGGKVLECDYPGYANRHDKVKTKVAVDLENTIAESNEENNTAKMVLSVK